MRPAFTAATTRTSKRIKDNSHCCITFSGLAKVAIFTAKLHAKHESSNLAKTVIRSTEPPLLPNPCYKLPFFFCQCSTVSSLAMSPCVGLLALLHFSSGFVWLQKCKCADNSVGNLFSSVTYSL
jgi:hypothetical protein